MGTVEIPSKQIAASSVLAKENIHLWRIQLRVLALRDSDAAPRPLIWSSWWMKFIKYINIHQNKYWTTIGYKYRWAKNLLSLIGIGVINWKWRTLVHITNSHTNSPRWSVRSKNISQYIEVVFYALLVTTHQILVLLTLTSCISAAPFLFLVALDSLLCCLCCSG